MKKRKVRGKRLEEEERKERKGRRKWLKEEDEKMTKVEREMKGSECG